MCTIPFEQQTLPLPQSFYLWFYHSIRNNYVVDLWFYHDTGSKEESRVVGLISLKQIMVGSVNCAMRLRKLITKQRV